MQRKGYREIREKSQLEPMLTSNKYGKSPSTSLSAEYSEILLVDFMIDNKPNRQLSAYTIYKIPQRRYKLFCI